MTLKRRILVSINEKIEVTATPEAIQHLKQKKTSDVTIMLAKAGGC
jgi:uncharacterized protein (DUF779 family)